MQDDSGGVGGRETFVRVTSKGGENTGDSTATADPDIWLRAVPGTQRATAATGECNVPVDGWSLPREQGRQVQVLCGLSDAGLVMHNKRVRWAASVYARHIPELREIAEPILRGVVEEDTELRWTRGTGPGAGKVEIEQLDGEREEEW